MHEAETEETATLPLTGDVMLGRGIDQILPHPSVPTLFEEYAKSAHDYVRMAQTRNGAIGQPVSFHYVWGEALDEIDRRQPDVRIINLETAVTTSTSFEDKGINYRMNPANIAILGAARIDACTLANNHVGDWGRDGLAETLATLHRAGVATAGAGLNETEAATPAILPLTPKGRVILIGLGSVSSGIPGAWRATATEPGLQLIPEDTTGAIEAVRRIVIPLKTPNDIAVASIHWGGNWGYEVHERQREIAHGLVEQAGVDIVHGHSSHHPRPIEVHRDKLVLYGCGDFINDYEGIAGYDEYRGDLTIAYLAVVSLRNGALRRLEMLPFRIRRLRLERASRGDARWLAATLNRESASFGTRIELDDNPPRSPVAPGAQPPYATLRVSGTPPQGAPTRRMTR
jgi:poly-gamma-glutamate capsule biosynthesis protein CapA/YwtB (metallophosphatase superfamily)